MDSSTLRSIDHYSQFVTNSLNRSTITHSTVFVWPESRYTGVAEGEVFFINRIRLRMREELDFDTGLITSYVYEVYHKEEKLYWYDDFPHPHDPSLASTHPHHKHIPPNMKRNRVPAPDLSFTSPNLSFLLDEIEELIRQFKKK